MTAIPASTLTLTAPPPSVPAGAGDSILVNTSTIEFDNQASYLDVPSPMYLRSADTRLYRTPSIITVVLDVAVPGQTATFKVDGITVATRTVPADTSVGPISLTVPAVSAGVHYVTATVGASTTSLPFTVVNDPRTPIAALLPDEDPQVVPGMIVDGTIQRWVLQDLMPGGLGSWVMPANPQSMQPIPRLSNVTAQHTVAPTGQFHLRESEPVPLPWSFAGYCPDQEFYNNLKAYEALNRRFYLIDHRNRAWTVTFDLAEVEPRKRQKLDDGTYNDWAGNYSVRAVIYDQTPKVPS